VIGDLSSCGTPGLELALNFVTNIVKFLA